MALIQDTIKDIQSTAWSELARFDEIGTSTAFAIEHQRGGTVEIEVTFGPTSSKAPRTLSRGESYSATYTGPVRVRARSADGSGATIRAQIGQNSSDLTIKSGAAKSSLSYLWPARGANLTRLFQKARRLLLTCTNGEPTAGTFTITIGGATTDNIAWNALADSYGSTSSVRYLVQAKLDTLTGNSAGWRVFVTGGTWPKVPYTLFLWNPNAQATIPAITIDTTNLTFGSGGSGVASVTDPLICQVGSSPGLNSRGEQLLAGNESFKTGEYGVVPVQSGAYSVDGKSWRMKAADTNGAPYAIWDISNRAGTNIAYDIREFPLVLEVYNPLQNVLAATLSVSSADGTSNNADCSFTLNPGYQECIIDGRKLPAGTTRDLSAIKALRVNTSTHAAGSFFAADSKTDLYVGALTRLGVCGGRTTVSIIFDDHLDTTFVTHLWALLKFPLKYGIAAVRDWAISGSRSTGANPPGGAVRTLAGLQALVANPQFRVYSHSLRHERYATGVDWESTVSTATDQSIEFNTNLTPGDGTTFTLTIPGVGTTSTLTMRTGSNFITPKEIGDALVALLGQGSVLSCGFGFTASARLGAQTSIRIQFATAQPIMTVALVNNGGVANSIRVGPSYTPERIAQAYQENAAYFRANNVPCPSDIWIPPQGNIHPRLIEAADEAGVRMIRAADAMGGHGGFLNSRFKNKGALYRTIPTRSIASGTTGAESFNGLMQQLMYCIQHGLSICFMGHTIAPSAGGATDIILADWLLFASVLCELDAAGIITIMFPDEQVDCLESLAGAA